MWNFIKCFLESSIGNWPVAIASVVSKVVERILLDRLSEYLENWELICAFTLRKKLLVAIVS